MQVVHFHVVQKILENFKTQGPNAASDSIPFGSTSTAQPTSPDLPTRSQPTYPDFPNDHTGSEWNSTLAVAAVRVHIPALPGALVGPVTQVVDILAEISEAIKTMRDGKKGCVHLISRVMNFLHLFVEDLKGSNVPVPDGSPTAARLFALKRFISFSISNLKAIKADVMRWSDLGLLERYIKRDEINTGLSRHGENLTDCLSMLHSFPDIIIKLVASKQ
ncbi:hypothetical protein BS47DRAFT_1367418 [Hydnum rufescens UP504]|uniref:Uncharacterized protein n=1 Tax=Hydnum rufescens UP504 TaxID=1448309 RepID=A0A9P6AI81_9AGAM|nr:hypothetical protein BS47DRAFT_1367418 [Hydnum rufescens UP504]